MRDYFDFTGQVALVTGGSEGIGRSTATMLAEGGASVVVVGRDAQKLRLVAETISRDTGATCLDLPGHVEDFEEMRGCFAQVEAKLGGLDILVNSAGINNPKGTLDSTVGEFVEVIGVNLVGTFVCCKLGAEMILRRKAGGAIINISSVQSRLGGRSPQYSASKAGVEGLTKSLARELGKHGIRVNALAPGGTETSFAARYWSEATREMLRERTILGRVAEPDEVAAAVVFLASRAASYITGTTLHVNGGLHVD